MPYLAVLRSVSQMLHFHYVQQMISQSCSLRVITPLIVILWVAIEDCLQYLIVAPHDAARCCQPALQPSQGFPIHKACSLTLQRAERPNGREKEGERES